jgi:hypothetical protein
MSHQPDNIFAGTQVVALVEIRGPNKSLVHPRGAVGVVTRTPTGDGEHLIFQTFNGYASNQSKKIEQANRFLGKTRREIVNSESMGKRRVQRQ